MTKEEEIELVCKVLRHPAGFDLDFAACLRIRTTLGQKETIEVEWIGDDGKTEKVRSFKASELYEAAKFFIELRHERQLGLDYEGWLDREVSR